jgi:hypothetical protein
MSETWQDGNNAYLSASLKWLRLRLQKLAPPPPDTGPQAPQSTGRAEDDRASWWFGQKNSPPQQSKLLSVAKVLPAGKCPSLDDQIQEAAAEREKACTLDPPPALLLLTQMFRLNDFERDTFLLCAALEFDPEASALCARAQGSPQRSYPTFALALNAFDESNWESLAPYRPLRYARMIEVAQSSGTPLTQSPLRADERIVNFLKGLNVLDERLTGFLTPTDTTTPALAASQQAVSETILDRLRKSAAEAFIPVVQLAGPDSGSRLAIAQQVCATLKRRLYKCIIESLPNATTEVDLLARLWQRESVLLPVALYIEAENLESATAAVTNSLRRFLAREAGLVMLGVRENPVPLDVPSFSLEAAKPTAEEQFQEWKKALDVQVPADTAAELTGQYHLNFAEIDSIATQGGADHAKLWTACRDLKRPRLDSLAQRLDVKATWNDLVLPDEQSKLMHQIAGQVRERHKVYHDWGFAARMNRGFGITALFAGESGTGKTMAAEVIANDLELNLYRIDLSAVVSKYIGETEKNLRQLFDAAEQGGSILFFDEADALFGKRSEVKDSHDRYANIEINYLLQRMESFSGLAILATNMKTALDPAFMRRLRFIVNFQFPSFAERKRIWEKALPADVPKQDLDFDRLSRLSITGGNIHSIVLNAAFMAAAVPDGKVTLPLLLAAARAELRKLERPFNEAELR